MTDPVNENQTIRKIVVTGATGFLGRRTVERLAPRYQVIANGRSTSQATWLEAMGANYFQGDLTDPGLAEVLVRGADAVVHCAALSSPWGSYEDYFRGNVTVTRLLVEACQQQGVHTLVNIGTPGIYVNMQHRFGVSEADPLPRKQANHYSATKLEAETLVLTANAPGLRTLSLRPRGIIGRGDTVVFPRLLRAYEEDKLMMIGNGTNVVDLTAVSNLVDAIELGLNAPEAAYGEAYNIANDDPRPLWDIIRYGFDQLGYQVNPKRSPRWLMEIVANLFEWHARYLNRGQEPVLTKYAVATLALSMTLDLSKARERLGYVPKQSTFDAIDEFVADWRQQENQG